LGREGSVALIGGGTSGVAASERSPLPEGKSAGYGDPSLAGLALRDPRNFLKRVPNLDEVGDWFCTADNCPDAADSERTGIVSTLVDAETSLGPEICPGSMRLRWEASWPLGLEGILFRSAMAASALRCTSFVSSCRLSGSPVAEEDEIRPLAFTEGDEGESVSRRERALAPAELSIRGGRSAGKPEPAFGSSVGSGDGEVRD
jgi:hypothetical protein